MAELTLDDLAIEHELARVAESFRFILDVTPVNVADQRASYLNRRSTEPTFLYRELEDDPAIIQASLDGLDVDRVEDTTLGHLLRAKHHELGLQLAMLRARETVRFRELSEELYGPITIELLEHAGSILTNVAVPGRGDDDCIDASEFALRAELELDRYRGVEPDIGAHVEVRPDVAGVMVSGNVLMVSAAACIHESRIDAILQHEVGTHLLTHINGSFQPLQLLAAGLAGYEETQEGLAVLAEFLVGGLSAFRLRQLAARVVAADQMRADASFGDVFDTQLDHGFSPRSAFTTTMRAFRCGGFTKDVIYLRGLLELLRHLGDGGDLDILWMGKMSLRELPLVDDLLARGLVAPARLLPRHLSMPGTKERLAMLSGLTDPSTLLGAPR
jgi:uncharacterized protein (TIGR02421 family)